DGYTFEHFFYDPSDTTTLSNSWIFDMTEDPYGTLWIGTKLGLNKYMKQEGRFSGISFPDQGPEANDNYIYGLAADDSSLYINRFPSLSILDLNTGEVRSYRSKLESGGALFDKGSPILRHSSGDLWIGSANGLCIFNPEEEKYTYFPDVDPETQILASGHITALLETMDGNVLVGTESGVIVCNAGMEPVAWYTHDDSDPHSLSHPFIQSMTMDHTGKIWIGTQGGGLNLTAGISATGSQVFTHYRNLADNSNFIGHDIVLSLVEDRSHNLWIGTLAGLDKADLKKSSINSYMKSDDPYSVDLSDNVIASVFEDKDRRLWIGTWGKGLNILDRKTNQVTYYLSEEVGERHIPENHVHVIFRDSQSRIWIGTRNGISILDSLQHRFIPAGDYFRTGAFDYFRDNRVYCMIECSDGTFWVGTGNGICILDTDSGERTLLREEDTDSLTISSNLVYSLLEDRDGEIWIATSEGLDRYDPATGRMIHYVNNPGSANTLCGSYIVSLCEDSGGQIWIGTNTGLSAFSKKDSTFTGFTTDDGLPSNLIYDIILDANGNPWFSTGGGLAMKNPDEDSPERFLVVDKLLGMEFNIKAVFRSESGEMFFGGIDGLVSFYPDSLTENSFIPPIRITSIEKENNGIRQRINRYAEEIDLSYRDYSFTIEFSSMDFTDPSRNRYSYKMEGISDQWIDIGTRRFVPFTNLPPGDYTFHVRGTNNDGVWNLSGSSIRIVIHPPWWRSTYAYAAYIIIVVFTIVIIFRWRERKLIREKRVLEEKVSARTAEIAEKNRSLEEQAGKLNELNAMKDTFFSILAHDLKNPFASLYSLSELAVKNYQNMDEDEKMTLLRKIKQSSGLIYNLLDNLLTWSRSQKGEIDYHPENFFLSNLVGLNINLHRVPSEKKEIRLVSEVPEQLSVYGDREMISTVLRNLIGNAVKYSHPGGIIEVKSAEKNGYVVLSVRDEGTGLSKEDAEKIFRIDAKIKAKGTAGEKGTGLGLIISRDFVEKNGGRIWCESEEGKGTTFYF
ncbi:MAG: ligand-binding sensor domain-containing protein, partial [Bacteroidales bacterium]